MEKILHPATKGGTANYSWLQAKYPLNLKYYFNSDMSQIQILQLFKDPFTEFLNVIIFTRNTLRKWKSFGASATSGNDNHVLLIEIPIQ